MSTTNRNVFTTITSLISQSGHELFAAHTFEETFAGDRRSVDHLATLLVQQENGVSFLISHFASQEALTAWRSSADHQRMIEALEAHSLRELCTIDRPVARVIVPSHVAGPRWKIFVTSWIVTFPLLVGLIALLDRLIPQATLLARLAVTSLTMSAAITWLISPVVLRLTRTWRLRHQQMRIELIEGPSDRSVQQQDAVSA
ncbi:MAG: hypothetical protein QHC67_18090 [Sphingobium sp.]|uniref:hypothetical protein n=1 Tax=Sphingobium sp. TaxID=1912891 RepID=UPI0029BA3AB9|nr:hypothetical protein [Sphingobium sp.]MDX3911689.1 hypothetical protein [Sphingobium sp.]